MTTRHKGTISQYYGARGFGFLEDETDEGASIFYHVSQVPGRRALKAGIRVTFVVAGAPPEKIQAVDLRILDDNKEDINDRYQAAKD